MDLNANIPEEALSPEELEEHQQLLKSPGGPSKKKRGPLEEK